MMSPSAKPSLNSASPNFDRISVLVKPMSFLALTSLRLENTDLFKFLALGSMVVGLFRGTAKLMISYFLFCLPTLGPPGWFNRFHSFCIAGLSSLKNVLKVRRWMSVYLDMSRPGPSGSGRDSTSPPAGSNSGAASSSGPGLVRRAAAAAFAFAPALGLRPAITRQQRGGHWV